MERVIDLSNDEARAHFLKGSSYFNGDMPKYISFEPILNNVAAVLGNETYLQFKCNNKKPNEFKGVNYNFIANKDGRFSWRPYELIHPAIYVSLVNEICEKANWESIKARFQKFEGGVVDCCGLPMRSGDRQSDVATQINSWWKRVEQRSLTYSLEFSHLLHTDVVDCYGSLYTHSIAWAIHGLPRSKTKRNNRSLLGNKIDLYIRDSRYGQTNGIAQGSVLMDFIAEIVLGWVDEQINLEFADNKDIRILRYRDDYRIFSNSDDRAEAVLKIVSDKLRVVGMKLGVSKTFLCRNIVEGSIKPDKLAGIELQDLGTTHAKTIQRQLLRLHSFGQRFPNSGTLRRLVGEFHTNFLKLTEDEALDDLEVQVAIVTDIAFVSPSTFPAVAGILSHLISLAPSEEKVRLWTKVREKMARVPYNGYLEIWLQRVTKPKAVGIMFESNEPICQVVNGASPQIWESSWISGNMLKKALDVSKIVISDAGEAQEVVQPEEIEIFKINARDY